MAFSINYSSDGSERMPTKEELVKCFQDTINIINSNNVLLNSTKEAMCCTNLITSNDNRIIHRNDVAANIIVIENTTFNAAKEYAKQGYKPVYDSAGNVDFDASRRVSFRFIINLDK